MGRAYHTIDVELNKGNNLPMQSNHFPDSFYRVSVKGIFVKDGKVLLVREAESLSGKWELPGGGLDFGEEIHQGLKREIEEEVGIHVTAISEKPVYVWTCRFEQGRNMDWYYSLVLGYQIELENLAFKVTEECEEIRFFSKEELETINLGAQTKGLYKILNLKDFVTKI